MEKADDIYKDYEQLREIYIKAKKKFPNISFSVQSQRRFHPYYRLFKELAREVTKETGLPITSIETTHSGGAWVTPWEWLDDENPANSYGQGFGKVSHTGYHDIDIQQYLLAGSYDSSQNEKLFDKISTYARFLMPIDINKQFTPDEQGKLLKGKHTKKNVTNSDLSKSGEVDARVMIELSRNNHIKTNITLNMLNYAMSSRSWASQGKRSSYAHHGRIRWEKIIIRQGYLQTIEYTETRSGDDQAQITVYRNPLVTTKDWGEHTHYTTEKLNYKKNKRKIWYAARTGGVRELAQNLHGMLPRDKMTSDFLTHDISVIVMRDIYKSGKRDYGTLTKNMPCAITTYPFKKSIKKRKQKKKKRKTQKKRKHNKSPKPLVQSLSLSQ